MNNPLKQVATVMTGFPFRGAVPANEKGELAVVQAKNITPGVTINGQDELVRVSYEDAVNAARLKSGDVLICNRATGPGGFKAAVCDTLENETVAASSVTIIRPDVERILPVYLAIFLNAAPVQDVLSNLTVGTVIRMLSTRELRQIKIKIPSLEKQQLIVDLHENTEKQINLLLTKQNFLYDIRSCAISNYINREDICQPRNSPKTN